MQEDPKQFGAADANLYRYTGNGPTDSVDPSGLDSQDPFTPDLPHFPPSWDDFFPKPYEPNYDLTPADRQNPKTNPNASGNIGSKMRQYYNMVKPDSSKDVRNLIADQNLIPLTNRPGFFIRRGMPRLRPIMVPGSRVAGGPGRMNKWNPYVYYPTPYLGAGGGAAIAGYYDSYYVYLPPGMGRK